MHATQCDIRSSNFDVVLVKKKFANKRLWVSLKKEIKKLLFLGQSLFLMSTRVLNMKGKSVKEADVPLKFTRGKSENISLLLPLIKK